MKRNYSAIPFAPAKVPFFYGWAILLLSSFGIIMSIPGQTMGVSAFTEHLIKALNISRSELTFSYMLGTIGSSFVLTYAGRLYDRIGARAICCLATAGLGMTLLFLSIADSCAALLYSFGLGSVSVIIMMFFAFFLLRFCGQGVLTMGSRNMMMKWFDKKRGLVTGISGPFTALGFSVAPMALHQLIKTFQWQGAWFLLGVIALFFFTGFVFIFFRDNPEQCGLLPDGLAGQCHRDRQQVLEKPFTLMEARRHYSFWVVALTLVLFAFYNTAMTFNIVSIFTNAGMSSKVAFSIFIPGACISVVVNLLFGFLADRVKMKFIVMLMQAGMLLANIAIALLDPGIMVVLLIIGLGLSSGLFGVVSNVTFVRYYGKKHLGEISGFVMSLVVFGSAIAPWGFSKCLDLSGSYKYAALGCCVIACVLVACSFYADSPQHEQERNVRNNC